MAEQDEEEHVVIPFRSKSKLTYEQQAHAKDFPLTIPKWTAKKASHVTLHHQHGARAWMCDHFFIKGNGDVIQGEDTNLDNARQRQFSIVLAFLHCNSRLFHAYIVDDKGLDAFFEKVIPYTIRHLPYETYYPDWIRNNNLSMMDTLICDAAFDRAGIRQFLESRGVRMLAKNMQRTQEHGYLAPIDRMARTLRDMIFNAKRITPSFTFNQESLNELCRAYNTARHETLSKLMGFKVTPNDVFWNLDLQDEITRRTYLQNYKIVNSPEFNGVHVGAVVYLHKPHRLGEKRRLNVEDTPYRVLSMNPITIENVVTHEIRSDGIHRKDLVRRASPTNVPVFKY